MGMANAATRTAIDIAPKMAAIKATTRAIVSAIRYVCGRWPELRGMIVEISAKDATGSSGLAAKDLRRPDVCGTLILTTNVAEVGDRRQLRPTAWAFQRLTSLKSRAPRPDGRHLVVGP